ncbi:exonuclease SbcCD subunit D C-terminal domain-containing protein [Thiorhodococcus fuscus]|uniref:Nuclease SbcCD subunit D n=1 Tax=Thiorhodococcus fuscus TaxID=527200 RepID=A0ABW4YCB8_9GAMM
MTDSRRIRVLHTSDWHLGRTLHGRKRDDEFAAFLDWLIDTVELEAVEVLLIAGDIFDTSAPSHRAQALYYRFLSRIACSNCRHLVVIAGNHDSPSFLDAPKALLRELDVHVVGAVSQETGDEVLVLRDPEGRPELIVCAVPYLRDRDIRQSEAGETIEDKERKLIAGIREHYAEVAAAAESVRSDLGLRIPIVGMGHLFTAGGRTQDGDGVRELYVGSLAHLSADIFPECFDYLALGHLHVPQRVAGSETMRYSGSPLPMGFGESGQIKRLCLVDLSPGETRVSELEIPVFQTLERIRGTWETIESRLCELTADESRAWIEVVYEGETLIGDLRERLNEIAADTGLEILRIRNERLLAQSLETIRLDETLADLGPAEVFDRCLESQKIAADQRPDLVHCYRAILADLDDADPLARQ